MLQSIRNRVSSEEKGFTLIELLVVVLIIGILAAIAIPAFLGQRSKAQDSSAKSMVRNAASATEAVAADNTGSYSTVTFDTLKAVEPSLQDTDSVAAVTTGQGVEVVSKSDTAYSIYTKSKSGNFYNITKVAGGQTYRCKTAAACTSNSGW